MTYLNELSESVSYTISYTILQMPWILLIFIGIISLFSVLTFKAKSIRAAVLPMVITIAFSVVCLAAVYCVISSMF